MCVGRVWFTGFAFVFWGQQVEPSEGDYTLLVTDGEGSFGCTCYKRAYLCGVEVDRVNGSLPKSKQVAQLVPVRLAAPLNMELSPFFFFQGAVLVCFPRGTKLKPGC